MESLTERKQQLIGAMYADKELYAFDKNSDRRKELVQLNEPKETADLILQELFGQKERGELYAQDLNDYMWHLLQSLKETANAAHAERVAEMLNWEEILPIGSADYNCRDLATSVLEILQKIGNPSVIPALEAFAEKIKSVRYSNFTFAGRTILASRYTEMDQHDIRAAIAACEERGGQSEE